MHESKLCYILVSATFYKKIAKSKFVSNISLTDTRILKLPQNGIYMVPKEIKSQNFIR